MIAINGYYNGSSYVTEGNIAVKPNQRVIITLLDEFIPVRNKRSLKEIKSYMKKGSRSIPDGISAVDYIRQLRED